MGGRSHRSTTNVGEATSPKAAFDDAGNAFVLWLQDPGFDRAVHAARHTPADGWLDPQMIRSGPGAEQHELDATLPIGSGYTIQSNRDTSGSGWGSPAPIGSSGGLIGTGMPSLAVGPSGEAFAIRTRGGEVRVNRFE
jgi:hypothetical protein